MEGYGIRALNLAIFLVFCHSFFWVFSGTLLWRVFWSFASLFFRSIILWPKFGSQRMWRSRTQKKQKTEKRATSLFSGSVYFFQITKDFDPKMRRDSLSSASVLGPVLGLGLYSLNSSHYDSDSTQPLVAGAVKSRCWVILPQWDILIGCTCVFISLYDCDSSIGYGISTEEKESLSKDFSISF